MFGRVPFKRSFRLLALAAFALAALTGLRYFDQSVDQAGLLVFIGLTLTTGFFHGALDIVLIRREFVTAGALATAVVLYGGSAVLLAMLCVRSGGLMIVVLLLMSVWHFGEPYGRWANGRWDRRAWVQRVVAGGAPVMLPLLLSMHTLQALLPMAFTLDAAWVFAIWQNLAWLWVGICLLGLVTYRQQLFSNPLMAEVAFVFAINLLLSPLMAFSIYFGVLHAGAHIFRFVAKHRQQNDIAQKKGSFRVFNRAEGVAIIITCLATASMMLILSLYLQNATVFAGAHPGLLNWVLIALTAVTLPHLVLVSRNSPWLTQQS